MGIDRIIFVAQSGTSREFMAKGILEDLNLKNSVEVLARGLVVLFPEPINQKAEAVLISNGINLGGLTSTQLTQEDITENTLIFTMESVHRNRILENYEIEHPEHVHVLNEFVGDELEILDPYGGELPVYGLCYEALRKMIIKLVKKLNEGE